MGSSAGIRCCPVHSRLIVLRCPGGVDGRRPLLDFLNRPLVGRCTLHTNEEMILVFNEEDNNTLVETILLRCHGVGGMREHAWLENGGQVLRVHAINVGLGGEDGEQIQDIKHQLAIEWRHLGDQLLIPDDGSVHIKIFDKLGAVGVASGLPSGTVQRVSKLLIQFERDYRLREVVEVATEDIGGIVNRVSIPHQPFAVPVWRVEYMFKFLYPFL